MSKILQAGELGFGIMQESDAGYISYDDNKNILSEGFEIKSNEPVLINCILQKWGVKNKNGRIYPKDVLMAQVEQYMTMVNGNSAMGELNHPDCVNASESMICTKEGWKFFSDISNNEEILTLNNETGKIEIQIIDEKIYEPYKGKMYRFKSKNNLDITVTENHRFLLDKKNKKEYYTAKEIIENKNNIFYSGKYKILKNGDWNGDYKEFFTLDGVDKNSLGINCTINLVEKYTNPISIKSEDWFAFMGIYLSEGHSTGAKSDQYKLNGYNVVITQKKEDIKILIKELLDKLPFDYWTCEHEDGKVQYHINDARLYNYLYPLGSSHTKYIPVEIKQASSNLLNILFEWFMIGDGRNVKIKNRENQYKKSVFSTSKKLIYDLNEILIKIGGNGNITTYQPKDRYIVENGVSRLIKAENSQIQYNLNVSKTKNFYLDRRFIKIEEIDFDDNIACVKVKNSNFLIMVNGKSHWTGNSSVIAVDNVSHLITKMWWGEGDQENILYGQLKLIVSPGFIKYGVCSMIGDKVVVYLQNKIKLGISSRGVGSLKEVHGENLVQNDFELIGFDLVSTPSTPGAYLFPANSSMKEEKIQKKVQIYENKLINAIDLFLD